MLHIPSYTYQFKGYEVTILRLEQAFPDVQGNKYFKLKYNLQEAREQQHDTLLTFGGAFSNYIHATAIAGKQFGFKTIGIIRGEDDPQNPTLQFAREQGMQLHFVSRELFKSMRTHNPVQEAFTAKYGRCYVMPEGGSNNFAVTGCSEILEGIADTYDYVITAVGTGGTLAGIIETPGLTAKVIGLPVLRINEQLEQTIRGLITAENKTEWTLFYDYHFGGYAKYSADVLKFIAQFNQRHQILLDPIYTGKMMLGAIDLMVKEKLKPQSKVLCIHTGGLQGWEGWNYRFKENSTDNQ